MVVVKGEGSTIVIKRLVVREPLPQIVEMLLACVIVNGAAVVKTRVTVELPVEPERTVTTLIMVDRTGTLFTTGTIVVKVTCCMVVVLGLEMMTGLTKTEGLRVLIVALLSVMTNVLILLIADHTGTLFTADMTVV